MNTLCIILKSVLLSENINVALDEWSRQKRSGALNIMLPLSAPLRQAGGAEK